MATTDEATRPDIEEQYLTSSGSSNLRVGNDSSIRTPGDLIAAAGMNRHRTGLALRRLLAEWDKSAKPHRMPEDQVEALAKAQKVEPPDMRVKVPMTKEQIEAASLEVGGKPERLNKQQWTATIMLPNPHAGMVRAGDGKDAVFRRPHEAAELEARRWHQNELLLLLVGLRTLPIVRDALVAHARAKDWEGDVHLVAQVLLWWLDSRCPACEGRRNKIIAGTGRTGAKPCGDCKGSGVKREPHGWQGAKLLAYMKGCLTAAARDLSEGTFKHQRTDANEHERERQRQREAGHPFQQLPPKIPPRRYSQEGRFFDGEYVSRAGDDVQLVTEMDQDGCSAVFVCVVAPVAGWCKIGDREQNLCRRYSKVEYDPKKDG